MRDVLLALAATAAMELAVLVGLPALLMWIVNRFLGRKPAIAIGFIAAAFVLYLIIDTYWACKAPPIFLPSPDGESEAATFPCDAPAGAFIYFFIWIIGPIAVALLLALTLFHYLKLRRYQ